jgi:hypothetical protein
MTTGISLPEFTLDPDILDDLLNPDLLIPGPVIDPGLLPDLGDLAEPVILSPVAAVATSSTTDRPVERSIDQSGLGSGFESGVDIFDDVIGGIRHAPTGSDEWFTAEGITEATVTYDLGRIHQVEKVALWNEDSVGFASAEASVSIDGASFTPLGTIAPANNQIGSYGAEVFPLPFAARYLRLEIEEAPQEGDSNTSFFSQKAGIGEIAVAALPVAPGAPEVFDDAADFLGALDRGAVIDFADVDTSGPDPVGIAPDRYADLGVILTGDAPGGGDGLFVDEDFGFPDQFSGPETANTAAPANTTARVTFTPEVGGAARAFGATFVDADFPGIAQAALIVRDASGAVILEEDVTTGNGEAEFVGLRVPDGAPGISEVLLVGGNGFPADAANEGVVFDDLIVGYAADAPVGPEIAGDGAGARQFTPLLGLDVTANDGPGVSVASVTGRKSGTGAFTEGGAVTILEDGTLGYTLNRDFEGSDSFRYTARDADGGIASASVAVEVTPIPEDLEIARLTGYLYEAGLGRFPDTGGLNFWIDEILVADRSERAVARDFLESPEFELSFGAPETLTDRALVEQLYLNVLDRPGEEGGIRFWLDELARPGFDRIDLLISFAESPENQLGSPRAADIRDRGDGSFDFGLVLEPEAGSVTEGETIGYTLRKAGTIPDGARFDLVVEGADPDGTGNAADPASDLAGAPASITFPEGVDATEAVPFLVRAVADGLAEGAEAYRIRVLDADGLELAGATTTVLDADGDDADGGDGAGGGGGGDDDDDGDGAGGGAPAASWTVSVSTSDPNPGFDLSGTYTGAAGQLTDPAGDTLINLDRDEGGTQESVWVITDPELPALSGAPQLFEADLISFNTTGPGGFPAVVANTDPFSSAQPPAELALDRVTAEVIEGSFEATVFDAFGAEYDVTGRFTLPNESMDLG